MSTFDWRPLAHLGERYHREDNICLHCEESVENTPGYMLKQRVWGTIADSHIGFLHLECAEERLGRSLTEMDFTSAPLNDWLKGVDCADLHGSMTEERMKEMDAKYETVNRTIEIMLSALGIDNTIHSINDFVMALSDEVGDSDDPYEQLVIASQYIGEYGWPKITVEWVKEEQWSPPN